MGPVDYFGMIERGGPLRGWSDWTMTKIALLGAGGKMGVRLATNLMGSPYEVMHVEISRGGRGSGSRTRPAPTASTATRRSAMPTWC